MREEVYKRVIELQKSGKTFASLYDVDNSYSDKKLPKDDLPQGKVSSTFNRVAFKTNQIYNEDKGIAPKRNYLSHPLYIETVKNFKNDNNWRDGVRDKKKFENNLEVLIADFVALGILEEAGIPTERLGMDRQVRKLVSFLPEGSVEMVLDDVEYSTLAIKQELADSGIDNFFIRRKVGEWQLIPNELSKYSPSVVFPFYDSFRICRI